MRGMQKNLTPWEEVDPELRREMIEFEPFLRLFGIAPESNEELEAIYVEVLEANIKDVEAIEGLLDEQEG